MRVVMATVFLHSSRALAKIITLASCSFWVGADSAWLLSESNFYHFPCRPEPQRAWVTNRLHEDDPESLWTGLFLRLSQTRHSGERAQNYTLLSMFLRFFLSALWFADHCPDPFSPLVFYLKYSWERHSRDLRGVGADCIHQSPVL